MAQKALARQARQARKAARSGAAATVIASREMAQRPGVAGGVRQMKPRAKFGAIVAATPRRRR